MKKIILCPNCNKLQKARVQKTLPFYTYIHHCTNCEYIITESEWKEVKFVKPI